VERLSGAAGTPGTTGPAGRGDRAEDRTRTSKYVLATEHENEFIGELPTHSPPVIGLGDDDE
jgi:hypothetical protein